MEYQFSTYFDYQEYEPVMPDPAGDRRHRVVIVGGGPIGLGLALDLADHGIPSVVLEADSTVSTGSRAGCYTRRTMEIFERIGVAAPTMELGYGWSTGWSYYHTSQVFELQMPNDRFQQYPPAVNLPQCFVEQFMVDEAARRDGLIEIRWQNRMTSMEHGPDGVRLKVETPLGEYDLEADWLVACDGARSDVRGAMGLRMSGQQYEGRYVIVDIRFDDRDMQIGRRAWFDPPSNPGNTVLMHKEGEQIWRFDYQLWPDEDAEEATKPENVLPRVRQHLDMLGFDSSDIEPIWISIYRANALSLDSYDHGRVLFAGDAAHLVPIFGVRGMNSGMEDAHNLAWKLALVADGKAPRSLLESYSAERVRVARENIRQASKSAEFMSPPSRAFRVMRDAVLSLSESEPWATTLIDPRQHSAVAYSFSELNRFPERSAEFSGGVRPGEPLVEVPFPEGGIRYLTNLLGPEFACLYFSEDGEIPDDLAAAVADLATRLPLSLSVVSRTPATTAGSVVVDRDGDAFERYDAVPGTLYLVRPDGYVMARWRRADAAELTEALQSITQQIDRQITTATEGAR